MIVGINVLESGHKYGTDFSGIEVDSLTLH